MSRGSHVFTSYKEALGMAVRLYHKGKRVQVRIKDNGSFHENYNIIYVKWSTNGKGMTLEKIYSLLGREAEEKAIMKANELWRMSREF